MGRTGGEDISSTGESSADFAKSDRPMPRTAVAGNVSSTQDYGSATDYDADYRTHFQTTYGNTGTPYDNYFPAYRFGERMAGEQQYQGRSFADIEPNLRRDYESSHPGSSWERMKEAIRYGWERVTGKAARRAGR
jgi:hypothetical protein